MLVSLFLFLLLLPGCHTTLDSSSNLTVKTDPSTDTYVGYVQGQTGRGTCTLLISCVITLILCVWSALHLNVPKQDQSRLSRLLLNIRWVIAGTYAPELVVFTAWRQWSSARLLFSSVQTLREKGASTLTSHMNRASNQWTMTHSFFACTGGFAFEIDALKGLLAEGHTDETSRPRRLVLTAQGIVLLARLGHLPYVPKEEIKDKSKTNNLAKVLVIIQAAWMLAQVIGRLAINLPVTLLEVNTVAHILCALAIYTFWWDKPLLPKEPIIIRDENLASLAAFMYISSEMSGHISPHHIYSQIKTLLADMNLYAKTPELETLAIRRIRNHPEQLEGAIEFITENRHQSQDLFGDNDADLQAVRAQIIIREETDSEVERALVFKLHIVRASQVCLDKLNAKKGKNSGTTLSKQRPRKIEPYHEKITDADKRRWNLASEALERFPLLLADCALAHRTFECFEDPDCIHIRPKKLVATHIQNWPGDDLLRNVNRIVVCMALWFANFCYGGLHIAVWNEHFPTAIECRLWRVSALYICICGGVWMALNAIDARFRVFSDFWERWADGKEKWAQIFAPGAVVFICGLILLLARMFIIVEAFASIRELPTAAYDTPRWTDIFPHF